MTNRLRNVHYDDIGVDDDGESANVSGLNAVSLTNPVEPNSNTMPPRLHRRSKLNVMEGISHRCGTQESSGMLDHKADGIFRSHFSRTQTGPSRVTLCAERTAVVKSRARRRYTRSNGSLLHHVGTVSYSVSSQYSHDNLGWPFFMFILTLFFTVTDACSTRPSPKPRPPRPIWSPDIGISLPKENCTDDYAELYCMNSGKCYRQKILESFIVSCECLPGYIGTRCQYRDIPDKYLPVQQRIETASIAGGVTVLIIIVTVFSMLAWLYYRRRRVFTQMETSGPLPPGYHV